MDVTDWDLEDASWFLVEWDLLREAGEDRGELAKTEPSEMLEAALSNEQDEEQEQSLEAVEARSEGRKERSVVKLPLSFPNEGWASLRSACLESRKESSDVCFFSSWKSSLWAEKSSWLRARPCMAREQQAADGKMAGSEHRRLKGFVKVVKMASEEHEATMECSVLCVAMASGLQGRTVQRSTGDASLGSPSASGSVLS